MTQMQAQYPAQPPIDGEAEEAALRRLLAQALAHHEARRLDIAERLYNRILATDPEQPDALHYLGVIAHQRGEHVRAVSLIGRAIALRGDVPAFHNNIGEALRALRRMTEAGIAYSEALRLNPDYGKAHVNLGLVLQDAALWHDAARHFRRAADLQPDAAIYANLSAALRHLGRLDEALKACDEALDRDPENAEAHNNRGVVLREIGREAEAVAAVEQALALRPDYPIALNNYGLLQQDMTHIDLAVRHFERAVEMVPDYVDAQWNLSLAYLLQGDFIRGFSQYEWRWQRPEVGPPAVPVPAWGGESLVGRTILLYPEQGVGDTIQFVRFAPLLKERGATVIVGCQPALAPLFNAPSAQLAGADRIVAQGEELPPVDCFVPMLSMPRLLATTLDSLPAAIPYLAADPQRIAIWQDRLAHLTRLRVGVVWSGNPEHPSDRLRSMGPGQFAPLLQRRDIDLISLQKGARRGDLDYFTNRTALFDAAPFLTDFAETAAAIMACDLVVTVDTAVAHLAGALGKPVWVLIAFAPDWRWMYRRSDSPWYPTLRLFRQPTLGDWPSVMAAVNAALDERQATVLPADGDGSAG